MNMLNYKNQKFIENDKTIEILDIHISIQRKNLLEIMLSVGRSDEWTIDNIGDHFTEASSTITESIFGKFFDGTIFQCIWVSVEQF